MYHKISGRKVVLNEILCALGVCPMASSLFLLFLNDLLHQILFYFGTVVAMGILLWEKKRDTPIHWRWVGIFFLFCLFVSCFQAWIDEHHNTEQLIKDKSDTTSEREFWKGQSYAKDDSLRKQQELLGENFKALTATQKTGNETQKSLTTLSAKILDVTKPEAQRTTVRWIPLDGAMPNQTVTVITMLTNKPVQPTHGILECTEPILHVFQSGIASSEQMAEIMRTPPEGNKLWIDVASPAWKTDAPIIAVVATAQPITCTFTLKEHTY